MPREKYRLQPVLDVRERAKQDAARMVSTRREQLSAAELELRQRKEAVTACRRRQAKAQEKMLEEIKEGLDAHILVRHRTHLADLRETEQELVIQVEEQKRAVANAEAEVEKAVAVLIELSRDVRVIEKHRESWRERTRREEQLQEQKIGDEIGAATYRRGRRE